MASPLQTLAGKCHALHLGATTALPFDENWHLETRRHPASERIGDWRMPYGPDCRAEVMMMYGSLAGDLLN